MKLTKIHCFGGGILFLLIFPIITATALSSWLVHKGDQLNYSFSYKTYDEHNSLTEDTTATIVILINNVGNNLTYDITCDVKVKVGVWGNSLKEHVEGSNLTSTDNSLFVLVYSSAIIYEASTFADKENEWVTLINTTEDYFWYETLNFTYYSADEITNMEFSSSADANGYKITASWDDYANLQAGSWSKEVLYSEEGILLKFKDSRRWVEKNGGSDVVLEQADSQAIPGLPISVLSYSSILGVVVLFLKKKLDINVGSFP
jgi:hypothetical protein